MRYPILVLALAVGLFTTACGGPKSGRGFQLPDGDPEKGKAVFVEMKCNACHTVEGVTLPGPAATQPVMVKLGGEVRVVQTYGQLVTSVINPSHRLAQGYPVELIQHDGESIMKNYNEVMTVQQLVDLVAFLQSHYKVIIQQQDYRF